MHIIAHLEVRVCYTISDTSDWVLGQQVKSDILHSKAAAILAMVPK